MKEHEVCQEEQESLELANEEVNVYAGCGKIRGCLVDCIDYSPMLSWFN